MIRFLSALVCFVYPGAVLIFLLQGPHTMVSAVAWTFALWAMVFADWLSSRWTKKPPPVLSEQFPAPVHDGILGLLALIQFANVGFLLVYASQLRWSSGFEILTSLVNLVVLRILVGTSSGSSGIIVAHELIHRPQLSYQWLGRLLMCSVCYEHFIIVHKRSHHIHVAQPVDGTTARRGEGYEGYCKRVYCEHFVTSWNFECQRLGLSTALFQVKMIKNRVLHGVLIEALWVLWAVITFGWVALAIYLYHCYSAVRLLEAINYFQHWGLSEQGEHRAVAWVNDSWVTRYALLGLSNHIDHHENASKPYSEIHYSANGPKMPYGYFVTNLWVKVNNGSYQRRALDELARFENTQP